jgi:hypothetical protein
LHGGASGAWEGGDCVARPPESRESPDPLID